MKKSVFFILMALGFMANSSFATPDANHDSSVCNTPKTSSKLAWQGLIKEGEETHKIHICATAEVKSQLEHSSNPKAWKTYIQNNMDKCMVCKCANGQYHLCLGCSRTGEPASVGPVTTIRYDDVKAILEKLAHQSS